MPRTHIRPVRLRQWFPPNDPVAAAVARLCILREDLTLELWGIVAEDLGRLDGNVEVFRRMYFWRNTLRTLSEIRDSLNRLMTHSDFRDALDAGPGDVRNAFHELRRKLNKSFDELFHDLRNTISAHLDEQLVADTLNKLDFDREGFIEIGDDRGGIHFRFAAELLVELILRDVPDKERLRVFDETLGGSAKLSQSVAAIDDALAVYMNARHLP